MSTDHLSRQRQPGLRARSLDDDLEPTIALPVAELVSDSSGSWKD